MEKDLCFTMTKVISLKCKVSEMKQHPISYYSKRYIKQEKGEQCDRQFKMKLSENQKEYECLTQIESQVSEQPKY